MSIPHSGNAQSLLHLLQLVSPGLPVGAYSYSEGLESVVQTGHIHDKASLEHWIRQELTDGAMRLEAAVVLRAHAAARGGDRATLQSWNQWLSAFRETEELRSQSWQMGRSLTRLLLDLEPSLAPQISACGEPCNFAIAFALAAAHWEIDPQTAGLGYLQSWANNLINAGIRLIPLGQTQGQQILRNLYPQLEQTVSDVFQLAEDDLYCCGWGVAIASMTHETLYSRLFRS